MRKLIPGLLAVVALVLLTTVALGQTETTTTTLTKTVQNPDGTYSIIEYPAGKEVTVALNPISLSGATGTATVLRDPDGTTIKLNLQGLPNTLMSLNMYAVDADGVAIQVWAVSPANKFVRLGQIVNTRGRNEAEIKSETTLPDFGLLVTMEDVGERMSPLGARIGVVEIIN